MNFGGETIRSFSIFIYYILILYVISNSDGYSGSLDNSDHLEELDCHYDNGKKWGNDTRNSYYGEPSLTTGAVTDCRNMRYLSCTIPDDGEISFSWMIDSVNQEYLDYITFSFWKNNMSIDKCSFIKWNPLNSYVVNKGDNLNWTFSLDSPPCKFEGKGWLFFIYNKSRIDTPTDDTIPIEKSCETILDLSPDGESDLTMISADVKINASAGDLYAANISMNFSDDFSLIRCEPEGFLSGANCTIKGRTLECNQINSANKGSLGYISLIAQLIRPKPSSNIWVCLDNISIKDIDGNDFEINRTLPCDSYCYNC